jgi:hypothetical protein
MGGIKPSESNILVKPELSQIDILKNEVMKLKNTLILKSKELDNLRFKNDSLEGRISELEVLPSKARYQYRDTITTPPANPQPLYNSIEKNLSATIPNVYSIQNVGRCSLEFDAVNIRYCGTYVLFNRIVQWLRVSRWGGDGVTVLVSCFRWQNF